MATLNKQPVFTSTPILVSQTVDVQRFHYGIYNPNSAGPGGAPTILFEAADDYGTLIERITVSTCGDLSNTIISEKFVHLFIQDNNLETWNLYKSAYIPYTEINATTLNHEIEWTFTGGILLPNHFKIGMGASTNYNNSGQYGDYLSITIEGSSYSQP
jgi:hypothetical protein